MADVEFKSAASFLTRVVDLPITTADTDVQLGPGVWRIYLIVQQGAAETATITVSPLAKNGLLAGTWALVGNNGTIDPDGALALTGPASVRVYHLASAAGVAAQTFNTDPTVLHAIRVSITVGTGPDEVTLVATKMA